MVGCVLVWLVWLVEFFFSFSFWLLKLLGECDDRLKDQLALGFSVWHVFFFSALNYSIDAFQLNIYHQKSTSPSPFPRFLILSILLPHMRRQIPPLVIHVHKRAIHIRYALKHILQALA